ncbi:hypothetical protein SEVIR_5G022100v4 [Setaria viridis]
MSFDACPSASLPPALGSRSSTRRRQLQPNPCFAGDALPRRRPHPGDFDATGSSFDGLSVILLLS